MTYLDNIIGQQAAKTRLKIYSESYKTNGILPFLLVVSARGCGKTKLVREFRKNLVREDGSRPPMLEMNCATISNAGQFFSQIYHQWVDNEAVLFGDELHALPVGLQEVFLTILEKDRNPIRRVTFNDVDYTFDFTRISFIGATTDHQK
jgi:Holliday junction resolvasome RuvABC ATP-dependent DNA helicase subunit